MSKASFVLAGASWQMRGLGVASAGTMLVPPVAAVAQQKVSVRRSASAAEGGAGGDLQEAQVGCQALAAIKAGGRGQPGKTAFDQYKINELLWYVYLQQGRNADAARVLEEARSPPARCRRVKRFSAPRHWRSFTPARAATARPRPRAAAVPEVRSGRQGHAAAGCTMRTTSRRTTRAPLRRPSAS